MTDITPRGQNRVRTRNTGEMFPLALERGPHSSQHSTTEYVKKEPQNSLGRSRDVRAPC